MNLGGTQTFSPRPMATSNHKETRGQGRVVSLAAEGLGWVGGQLVPTTSSPSGH